MPPRRAAVAHEQSSGIEILVPLFERFLEDQAHLRETNHQQVTVMTAIGLRTERTERLLETKVLPALDGSEPSAVSRATDKRIDAHAHRLDKLEAHVDRLVKFVTFVFGGSSVLSLVVVIVGVALAVGTAFGWWSR